MSPKERILDRRARFVAAALASSGLAACGDSPANPGPSLADTGVVKDGSVADTGATADTGPEETPEPCLGIAYDSGSPYDSGYDAAPEAPADAAADTGPVPCLAPPPG